MRLIYHDVNHYDTSGGYIGVEFTGLNVYVIGIGLIEDPHVQWVRIFIIYI